MTTKPNVMVVGPTAPDLEALFRDMRVRAGFVGVDKLEEVAADAAHHYRAVVLDVRGSGRVPPGVANLRKQSPETGVVLLCRTLESSLMLEAMRAGVMECVAEPLSATELRTALTRVSSASFPDRVGASLAFVGTRGGIGTTTLAVNVACAIEQQCPGDVLLVDLHLEEGDAAVVLGMEPRFSVVDALENTERLDESFFNSVVTVKKGLPALLASSEGEATVKVPADRIRALLAYASTLYRFVILDVPRFDRQVREALDDVSTIVLVASQDMSSVKYASRALRRFERRYGRARLRLAVNRHDPSLEISDQDIERVVGMAPGIHVPNDYRLAVAALNQGVPLVMGDSRLGRTMKQAALELVGIRKEPQAAATPAASRGFLGLLAPRRT